MTDQYKEQDKDQYRNCDDTEQYMNRWEDKVEESYMASYKKETSQIYAPANLILKTKQTVAQEEKGLEQGLQPKTAFHISISKWIIPITAAAALMFIFHVSRVQFSRSTADLAGGINEETPVEYEAALAEEEMLGTVDGVAEAVEGSAAGGVAESECAGDLIEDRQTVVSDEMVDGVTEDASVDAYGDSAESSGAEQEKLAEEKRAISGQEMTIEEVTRVPIFYRASETERVESHGISFYIAENNSADAEDAGIDGWKAYVEYGGKKYVIAGSVMDQEEFLAKAYKMLEEKN